MKVFVTKDALKRGIHEAELEPCDVGGGWVQYPPCELFPAGSQRYYHPDEYELTREAAVIRARLILAQRMLDLHLEIRNAEVEINRLRTLEFE
jgi:hypothetical protein